MPHLQEKKKKKEQFELILCPLEPICRVVSCSFVQVKNLGTIGQDAMYFKGWGYILYYFPSLIIIYLFHHTFKPTDIMIVIILFQMRNAKGIWPKDNNCLSHLHSALLGFVHHGTTVCPQ